ncbi:MAG: hypothetical protein WCL39_06080 [Armatimonadota bacterium]
MLKELSLLELIDTEFMMCARLDKPVITEMGMNKGVDIWPNVFKMKHKELSGEKAA